MKISVFHGFSSFSPAWDSGPGFLINMGGIIELYNRIRSINLDQLKEQIISENEGIAVDMNKDQLEQGLDSNNSYLRAYRSPAYAAYKNQLNPRPGFGNPDLLLSGDFYKGFTSEIKGDRMQIASSDEKNNKLKGKYGEDIFGLNPANTKQFKDVNRESYLRNWIKLAKL